VHAVGVGDDAVVDEGELWSECLDDLRRQRCDAFVGDDRDVSARSTSGASASTTIFASTRSPTASFVPMPPKRAPVVEMSRQ
jgi:hypothetical protein